MESLQPNQNQFGRSAAASRLGASALDARSGVSEPPPCGTRTSKQNIYFSLRYEVVSRALLSGGRTRMIR